MNYIKQYRVENEWDVFDTVEDAVRFAKDENQNIMLQLFENENDADPQYTIDYNGVVYDVTNYKELTEIPKELVEIRHEFVSKWHTLIGYSFFIIN